MKITTEQYTTLKLLADDVASARMAPKHLERYIKIVVQDEGKDRIVQKFSPDATRAAILVHMVQSVEIGMDPLAGFNVIPTSKKAVEDQSQEVDVFTAEALAKIPAGKPDHATLAPPKVKASQKIPKDILIHHGNVTFEPLKEGDVYTDAGGRIWKIINGKKVQQKKPRPDKAA